VEVEVKFKVDDDAKIKKRLNALGAKYLKTVIEYDHYYQHPCKNFKESDEALRVRVYDSKCELTYKGPRVSDKAKAREEISVDVSHFEKLDMILIRLGFRRIATVIKKRSIYLLGDFKVSIDKVRDLGIFVEIEYIKPVGQQYLQEVINKLKKVAKELGVKGPSILKSYLELLLEKQC